MSECSVGRKATVRWVKIFVLLGVLWWFYYPLRMERLFRAIPHGMTLGSYHRNLAHEWRRMSRHPQWVPLLERAGIEEAVDWADDEGIFQTLYWLTGPHTVFGVRADWDADWREEVPPAAVFGASYVGWKARPMELLWRIRWIPGLGWLDVTPQGTRYLSFRKSKSMQRLGLVLSLDIFEGVLVGVLSPDPDAVRELALRVRLDADVPEVFGDDREPWRTLSATSHRLWVPESTTSRVDPQLGGWRLDVASFEAETVEIDAEGPPLRLLPDGRDPWLLGPAAFPCGPPIPAEAPFAAILCSMPLLEFLWPPELPRLPSGGEGLPWLTLAGGSYGGSLMGLTIPSATLRLPWPKDVAADRWVVDLLDAMERLYGIPPVGLRTRTASDGGSQFLLTPALEGGGVQAADEGLVFMEARHGALAIGSHLGSHQRQGPETAARTGGFARAEAAAAQETAAALWLWIDAPRAYQELRHVTAVAQLAARLSSSRSSRELADVLAQISRGVYAASALDDVMMTLALEDERVRLRLRAEARPR